MKRSVEKHGLPLAFGVWGVGCRVWGVGSTVQGRLRFAIDNSGLRAQGLVERVGVGCEVERVEGRKCHEAISR